MIEKMKIFPLCERRDDKESIKMIEQDYRNLEFANLGFRCVEPANVLFLNGTKASVSAYGHRCSKDVPGLSPRERRALNMYAVRSDSVGPIEILDELELEEKLGKDSFDKLK